MEITTAPTRKSIDYKEIAEFYNRCQVGQAVKLKPVSNITLFKQALAQRGLVPGVDFQAASRTTEDEDTGQKAHHTYIAKLTTNHMRKD